MGVLRQSQQSKLKTPELFSGQHNFETLYQLQTPRNMAENTNNENTQTVLAMVEESELKFAKLKEELLLSKKCFKYWHERIDSVAAALVNEVESAMETITASTLIINLDALYKGEKRRRVDTENASIFVCVTL